MIINIMKFWCLAGLLVVNIIPSMAQASTLTCKGEFGEGWDNCVGLQKFADGSIYQGGFKRGGLDGYGLMSMADGMKILSQFKNNQIVGVILLIGADGSRYVGGFDGNVFNGEGVLISPNGERREGLFQNGNFIQRRKINDSKILALLAAEPVYESVSLLNPNASKEGDKKNNEATNVYEKFKNKKGQYYSLYLTNQSQRVCSISSEDVIGSEVRNPDAELVHNLSIISYVTNIEKHKPNGFELPKLLKPAVDHQFISTRGAVKWWLPNEKVIISFNDHFESNHEPWANKLLNQGLNPYVVNRDFIDKIGRGVINTSNHRYLPGDNYVDSRGCSVLIGFENHIKQAADGLTQYGHKFQIGKPVPTQELLENYAEDYWNVKWETYKYVRYNLLLSPSTMLILRDLNLDSQSELSKLVASYKDGVLDGNYFSGLKEREKRLAIEVYLQDLYNAKKSGGTLLSVRDSRQKSEDAYVNKLDKLEAAKEKERKKQAESDKAEAIAREKRRDALRANMKINTGITCVAEEFAGAKEINYIAGMYANNTNIAIISSYVSSSNICFLSQQTYPAKNFKRLSGYGQMVTLQSRVKNANGKYVFTLLNGKGWHVD